MFSFEVDFSSQIWLEGFSPSRFYLTCAVQTLASLLKHSGENTKSPNFADHIFPHSGSPVFFVPELENPSPCVVMGEVEKRPEPGCGGFRVQGSRFRV